MGSRVGAADRVFLFDYRKEGGVISCVDGVGEVVVGIFDEDRAGNLVSMYYCGHGVDDIPGLLLGVEEIKFAAFVAP